MKILHDTVEEIKDLLYNKGTEYANDFDVLANFKRGSQLGITAKQKLGVYLEKHMAAIWSYIANGRVYSEGINGRINDAINYLIFLKDLIYEEENDSLFREQQEKIRSNQMTSLSAGGLNARNPEPDSKESG